MGATDDEGHSSKHSSHGESGAESGSSHPRSGQKSSGMASGMDSPEEEESESEQDGDEEEGQDDLHDLPEEGEVKEELVRAITDEFREYETLQRSNQDLQQRIIKNGDGGSRDGDVKEQQVLSEHKYLNTLANVH